VALRSRFNGQLCAFQKDIHLRDLGDTITKNWEWAWLTELDDDLEEAVRLVEDRSFNVI
jgi:salicylate hydroxylase